MCTERLHLLHLYMHSFKPHQFNPYYQLQHWPWPSYHSLLSISLLLPPWATHSPNLILGIIDICIIFSSCVVMIISAHRQLCFRSEDIPAILRCQMLLLARLFSCFISHRLLRLVDKIYAKSLLHCNPLS